MALNKIFCKYVFHCQLLEGVAVCPGAVPHEARVDVLLDAAPRTEAQWLRIVTTEIDHVRTVPSSQF